jgi:tripartite-type tricarboxylate transporter receptor subunit TctC
MTSIGSIRRLGALLALAVATLLPLVATAQSIYPSRPILMIVPLAAGSAVDVAARIVAQKMSVSMGQSIVVENMPGAAGVVGADRVAKAAPDGYTIGGFNDSIANPQAPFGNVTGLIQAASAAPGKIDYGSGGIGSPQHIAMALFASQAGVAMTHVPYKGATQAAIGVAGGEVPVAFEGLATVNSLIRSNKVRLIAVSTPKRMPQYADVPTVSEAGLPGFEFNSWFAVLAPAATPAEIVARLNAEILKALADPAVREQLIAQGLTPRGSSADELARATKAQLATYAALIRKAGIKPE